MVKKLLIITSFAPLILGANCVYSYDVNGCGKVDFDLGQGIVVNQYKVIYDKDHDDVSDNIDKCPDTVLKAKVDSVGCEIVIKKEEKVKEPHIVEELTLTVNFDTAKYEIKDEYMEEVNAFAEFLSANSQYSAEIIGHTDSVGLKASNIILSSNRAKAIKNKLVELGIEETRITVKGMGEDSPFSSNEDEDNRAMNRRIEVLLTKIEE